MQNNFFSDKDKTINKIKAVVVGVFICGDVGVPKRINNYVPTIIKTSRYTYINLVALYQI